MRWIIALLALTVAACSGSCASSCTHSSSGPRPAPMGPDSSPAPAVYTKIILLNLTDAGAVANVSVGNDSVAQPCGGPSNCSFPLAASASQELSTDGGQYTNVSVAFNGPVGCGSTIAEATANNANGYGTADVSLVNGFNAKVQIMVDGQQLGPALDAGNANVFGVFPVACDICVARSGPPCGFSPTGCTTPGSCGCKSGTQYNPTVPCQATYQKADAGSLVNIALVP